LPTSSLNKAIHLVSELRKIDPEMPMQIAHVFLVIAEKPGICQREIAAETKIGKSSVSRIVEWLGTGTGKGLVSSAPDFDDRRVSVLMLTEQGHRVLRRVIGRL
jgi:DNA-binding MarR family transcriptional regulator